jgi:hypothetical protein
MEVYIFILCYNEEVLLPHTIAHYRANIPDCHIIIYDNMSTDNSVNIAKNLGCAVIQWQSDGINDYKYINIKNNCWKNIKNGWILCIDMDEWLCITDDELLEEYLNGTTVLNIKGVNIVGDSKTITLNDINLHKLSFGVNYAPENKKLCFFVPGIKGVNYSIGAHCAVFTGNIKYSKKTYINKHMELLGLSYYINKKDMRNKRLKKYNIYNFHMKYISKYYSSDINLHTKKYLNAIKNAKKISLSHNDNILLKILIDKILASYF